MKRTLVLDRPGLASGEPTRPRRARRWMILAVTAVVVLAVVVPIVVVGLATAPRRVAVTPRPTVLLIGDSLIHQAADGIRAALPDTSVIDGSVGGSGLLNGPVDWSARATILVARYHPGAVVVSFIGNYDQYAGRLVPDSPAYYKTWADAAKRLTDQLRTSGTRVDWVEQPPVHFPNFVGMVATRTHTLLAQSRRLAAEPGVGLVSASAAVAAPDGSYTTIDEVCGTLVTLRIADGVHFTTIGGDWWGANLGRAVRHARGIADPRGLRGDERAPPEPGLTVVTNLDYFPMSDFSAAETSSLASAATRNPATRADLVARTQADTNLPWLG